VPVTWVRICGMKASVIEAGRAWERGRMRAGRRLLMKKTGRTLTFGDLLRPGGWLLNFVRARRADPPTTGGISGDAADLFLLSE